MAVNLHRLELLHTLWLKEGVQTVQAVDVQYFAKEWKGLSLQIHSLFCTVLLHYIMALELTRLVILDIALASFRSM